MFGAYVPVIVCRSGVSVPLIGTERLVTAVNAELFTIVPVKTALDAEPTVCTANPAASPSESATMLNQPLPLVDVYVPQ